MDTSLIVALIGVGSAFAGVVGTIVVAVHSQRQTNHREERRLALEQERLQHEQEIKERELKHERELKQAELEDARQEKRREERIKAHRDFLNAVNMNTEIKRRLELAAPGKETELAAAAADQMTETLTEVLLVGPPYVGWHATYLSDQVRNVGVLSEDTPPEQREMIRAQIPVAKTSFVDAAKYDLGTHVVSDDQDTSSS